MKKFFVFTLCALAIAAMASACNDTLDIDNAYGFRVEHLPVLTKLARGETAEIRLQLIREGRWTDAKYQMRYFQPDGRGRLADTHGVTFIPNDLYNVENEKFRLYYTSLSDAQQTIDLYFIDNNGKMSTLSFTFNNQREENNQ